MKKATKNRKLSLVKIDLDKFYSLDEASELVKEITTTKFDSSVDLAIRLGVDPKNANEMIRGVVSLPHGTGKSLKVLALVSPDKEDEAKKAGADLVGLDEYIEKIKKGYHILQMFLEDSESNFSESIRSSRAVIESKFKK